MESQPQVESIARSEPTNASTDCDSETEKKPIHISIRLIGDRGIGKTLIVDTFLGKKTHTENEPSSSREDLSTDTSTDTSTDNSTDTTFDQGLSQEYSSSINVDGKEVILHIWSGTIHKDFEWHPLVAGVYNEGLMFVFDSTDEASYESIKQQFSIYYLAGDYSNRVDKPEVVLVGTNCHTDNKIRFYDWVLSELTRYMEDHTGDKFIGYYETNSATGVNVKQVFDVLINKVLDNCDPSRREVISPIDSPTERMNTKIDFINAAENPQITRSDRRLLKQNLNKAKRQHGKIPVRFIKVFFTGSGAAGKTSFVRLLLKKQFRDYHHSTNVVHTNHAVSVKMAAFQGAPTKEVTWVELDSSIELSYLRSVLLSRPSRPPSSHPSSPSTSRKATATSTAAAKASSSIPVDSENYLTPIQQESTLKSFFAGLFASSVKVSDLATFENLVSSTRGRKFDYQPGQVLNIITLLDTGGQPEYIHLLPTINIYPTVTFVVHNLLKSLNDQVLVEFSQHGKLIFAPYHLSYSNLDMIKLLMSAANDSVERPTSRIPQLVTKPGINNKSYICLVGTHMDQVPPKTVKKTDKMLTDLVKKTQCEAAVWQKANGSVLFSVDNTTSGNESIAEDPMASEMRKRIESLAAQKEVYELPITWMLLELEIQQICSQKNKAYISFQECVAVARDTSLMSDVEEVKSVLQYHHLLGVLIYFEEVPGLNNYVIVDHQWWFDKLSSIICVTFQQASYNFHAVQRLKYQGILSKELLKHVEWKDDIKEDFFLSLLIHMKIIAPLFTEKRKKGEKGRQPTKKEYFIPYVLPTYNFNKKGYQILKQYGNLLGEPLLIQFKSGLLPRGLFCSLLVELLQHPLKGWEPHFSNDKKSHTFSNLITFSLPNGYSLSLLDRVSYLEVQIRHPEEDFESGLSEEALHYSIHNKVCNYLIYSITEVCVSLNFSDDRLQYGFLCKNCEHHDENHIAIVPLSSSSMMYAKCSINSVHQIPMMPSNLVWFMRDQIQNSHFERSISFASSVDSGISTHSAPVQYDRSSSVPGSRIQTGHYRRFISHPVGGATPNHLFTQCSLSPSLSHSSQISQISQISPTLDVYVEADRVQHPFLQKGVEADRVQCPSLQKGPNMEILHKIVIYRIASKWSMVADFLEYSIEFKELISAQCKLDPLECCACLLQDWLSSERGVSPKSWCTLIGTLRKIKMLTATTEKIVNDLKQEGIHVDVNPEPTMKLLHEIVIPKIASNWDMVADSLEYEMEFKDLINAQCKENPLYCCVKLLEDWLTNDRGISPKTWSTLIEAFRKIKVLTAVTEKIVLDLKQEGIIV